MQQPATQDEPKQKTLRGYEIPVPTKRQVTGFFKKVIASKRG